MTNRPSSYRDDVKKVVLLGSGALKIGEAGEFDYSGSQAIKAMQEEGIEVVLVNPNIATNQTSKGLADKVYFLPVTPFFVEQVIAKEQPDGILLAFGGQTALNCGVQLEQSGVLAKYNVDVLGTPVATIEKTEDREMFNKFLRELGVHVPKSIACTNKEAGMAAAQEIGFPVMVRAAYALGGKGSGFAYNEQELAKLLTTAFAYSPQVLVEENLKGWKEIEYEVVRDGADNCITVCNMENFDPLGIHTGESIVIAPSQTLDNTEYQLLRDVAIKVIRALGVVGECNIQYALDPESREYRVIEVNARLSRSSALASKATGYPLAFIAAKLALGYRLIDLKNMITQDTSAFFEPALDYVALKLPRWDLNKFQKVSTRISSEMKSVGEIMALGRSFEEVMQKGMRMLQVGFHGFSGNAEAFVDESDILNELENPTPRRLLAIYEAFKKGWTPAKINEHTGIDTWFLTKLAKIVQVEAEVRSEELEAGLMRKAKMLGFSDKQLATLKDMTELEMREKRKALGVLPVVRQIDTLAAEYPAQTNYLYVTYHGSVSDKLQESAEKKDKRAIVLGSGAYCIGSSVEFDWCCVNAIEALADAGYETIMINYNPETVSTDYDTCDKLYFEELSLERVLDIYDFESPDGVVVSMGGQIPNNIALKLAKAGVEIIGTDAQDIDRAESRDVFSALLDEIGVDQPAWAELASTDEAVKFADEVGYPVLVRPSYVLSGAAMSVAHNSEDLETYLAKAVGLNAEAAVVVSKFEQGAKEIEVDAVAHKGEILIYAISEHIENAGVHSGDATIVLPPQKLYLPTMHKIKSAAKKIARSLNITGPFNIQFLAKNNEIKVIECNLRASRSFPFASKVTGYNFIEIATKAMLGQPPTNQKYKTIDLDHVGVKAAQFSFSRLKGADPVLGVEMASTGEVACFGDNVYEALLKSLIAVGFKIPKQNILLSVGRIEDKVEILNGVKQLAKLGYNLLATEGTANFLAENGVEVRKVYKAQSEQQPNILDVIHNGEVDLVINIPKQYSQAEVTDGYLIRRNAVDSNVPLLTNVQLARLVIDAIQRYKMADLPIVDWATYGV